MPTYEYVCTQCGHRVEAVQSMTDEPLRTCGVCGGELRKVFHPAGVVFKGSGFYATDSRAKKKEPASSPSGASKDPGPSKKDSSEGSSPSSSGSDPAKSSSGKDASTKKSPDGAKKSSKESS